VVRVHSGNGVGEGYVRVKRTEGAVEITVRGVVQGVGFRAFVYREATELDLKGYVKNQVDNTVFVEIEGEESLTNSFVAKCKVGPGWSHVEQIEMEEYPVRGFVDFKIKY
jgi:acylphosphatase